MRVPEMPLEPVVRADVGIGPYGEGPEDEDRIHELVKRANEYIRERLEPVAIDDRRYRREAQHG